MKLVSIQAEMISTRQVTDNISATYDRMCTDSLGAIRYLLLEHDAADAPAQAAEEGDGTDGGQSPPAAAQKRWTLQEISEFLDLRTSATQLMIVDRAGNIRESNLTDDAQIFGAPPDLRSEELAPLFEVFEGGITFSAPVEVVRENDADEDTRTARRYYSTLLDDNRMAVIGMLPYQLGSLQTDLESWAHIISIADCGAETTSFVVSAEDDTVVYHPDESLRGKQFRFNDYQITASETTSGLDQDITATLKIEEEETHTGIGMSGIEIGIGKLESHGYIYARSPEIDGIYLMSGIDPDVMANGITRPVIGETLLFAILAALMALYALLVCRVPPEQMNSEKRWKKRLFGKWQDKLLYRKLQGWLALCGAVLFFATLLARTLFSLSHYSMNLIGQEKIVSLFVTDTREDQKMLTKMYTESIFSRCRIVSQVLSEKPDRISAQLLDEMCDSMGIEYITVLDNSGVPIASNAGPSTRAVIRANSDITENVLGRLPAGVDYVEYDREQDHGSGIKLIGCRMRDAANKPVGTLLIVFDSTQLNRIEQNLSLGNLLRSMHPGEEGFAFSIDQSTGRFTYYPEESHINAPASDFGITEAQIVGGYQGFITLDDVSYMAYSIDAGRTDDEIIYLVVPESEISMSRVPYAIIATLLGLLLMLPLYRSLTVRKGSGKGKDRLPPADPAPAAIPLLDKENFAAARYKPIKTWLLLPPGSQLFAVLKGLLMAASICISLIALCGVYLFGADSTIMYVLQRRWEPGVNVFAFTACGILIAVVVTTVALLKLLLDYVFRALNLKSETIRKLLHSVIRYGATLLTLYLCLSFLGVDANAMIASIGVFSLVVGLGAQPLVSDIIAGMFAIVEGTYKVGDIINVNGYRGTVQEIGLRTTRVVGPSDNVMILNNRNISNVINMSNLSSIVTVTLTIAYNEDLDQIEALLKEHLPGIAQRIPDITDGPYYSGIEEIGGNSIKVKIVAYCREVRHNYVIRDLNRELIRLFEIDGGGLHGTLKNLDIKAQDPMV